MGHSKNELMVGRQQLIQMHDKKLFPQGLSHHPRLRKHLKPSPLDRLPVKIAKLIRTRQCQVMSCAYEDRSIPSVICLFMQDLAITTAIEVDL
jgi:hypothetical protein